MIWTNFTTDDHAHKACKWGGIAILFQAVREFIGALIATDFASKPLDSTVAYLIGASLVPVFLIVAAIRLWRRASWRWAVAVLILLAVELLAALTNLTASLQAYRSMFSAFVAKADVAATSAVVAGLIVKVGIMAFVVNGARAGLYLQKAINISDVQNPAA